MDMQTKNSQLQKRCGGKNSNSTSEDDLYFTASSGTSSDGFVNSASSRFNKRDSFASASDKSDQTEVSISEIFEIQDEGKCIVENGEETRVKELIENKTTQTSDYSVAICDSNIGSSQSYVETVSMINYNLCSKSYAFSSVHNWFRIQTIQENETEIINLLHSMTKGPYQSENYYTVRRSLPLCVIAGSEETSGSVDISSDKSESIYIRRESKEIDSEYIIHRDESLQSLIFPSSLNNVKSRQPIPQYRHAEEQNVQQYFFKVLMTGENTSGKSKIIQYFLHSKFHNNNPSNKSVDLYIKVLNWNKTTKVQLSIWDISDEKKIDKLHYKDAYGAIMVCDTSRPNTLESITKWKNYVDENILLPIGDPIPCIFLAHKTGLKEDESLENLVNINSYCEKLKFSAWFVISTKDGTSIERAFNYIIVQMLQNQTTFCSNIDKVQNKRTLLAESVNQECSLI